MVTATNAVEVCAAISRRETARRKSLGRQRVACAMTEARGQPERRRASEGVEGDDLRPGVKSAVGKTLSVDARLASRHQCRASFVFALVVWRT